MVNVPTDSVTNVITDTNFDFVYYFAVTPNSKTLYVVNDVPASVSIVDVATNQVTGLVSDPGLILSLPYSIAMFPAPQAPQSVQGAATANVFLTQEDRINILRWQAPLNGPAIVGYRIYRDAALTDLAGFVPASGQLYFADHNRKVNVPYTYYIVSVDQGNNISNPAIVRVIQRCTEK